MVNTASETIEYKPSEMTKKFEEHKQLKKETE